MAAVPQTNSRIANASISWQGACDVDITNWNKTNEFIIATYAYGDSPHGNDSGAFKLQWRRAGGSFVDVGADTEIAWGTGTSLVDGTTPVTSGAGCLTVDDSIENEGDNACSLSWTHGTYCEIQWALKFGSGAQDSQEYEIQLVDTTSSNSAICSCSITTAAGATKVYGSGTINGAGTITAAAKKKKRVTGSIGAGAEELLNKRFYNWTGDEPDDWSHFGTETGSNYVTEHVGKGMKIVSVDADQGVYQATIVGGTKYRVKLNLYEVISGACRIVLGDTSFGNRGTAGVHFLMGTAGVADTNAIVKRQANGAEFTVREVSIKPQTGGGSITCNIIDSSGTKVYGSGTINGSGSVTCHATARTKISGTINGASTITCDIGETAKFSGTVNGASTITCHAVARTKISGTINGVSTITCHAVARTKISGTINGVSTITCDIGETAKCSGTITATSTISCHAVARTKISGTINGVSSLTCNCVPASQKVYASGTISGAASVTCNAIARTKISGTISGAATVTCNAVARTKISGTVAATSTVTCHAVARKKISGTINGVSSVSAHLARRYQVSGTINGGSSISCQTKARRMVRGTISGSSSVTARLVLRHFISGTINGGATITCNIISTAGVIYDVIERNSFVTLTKEVDSYVTQSRERESEVIQTKEAKSYIQ